MQQRNASYAAESEKRNTAQFETVLDTSFNGIIKVNAEGKVIVVNKLVENLLGKNSEDLVGKSLTEILPGIDSLLIENIFKRKERKLFHFCFCQEKDLDGNDCTNPV